MAAISVNLDLCGEKENFLFRKMFRSLVCPPAFGPAKRFQNFGPFRTAVSHFRRFAFRVSLSQFRDARRQPRLRNNKNSNGKKLNSNEHTKCNSLISLQFAATGGISCNPKKSAVCQSVTEHRSLSCCLTFE
jgi:hypothetical protein